MERGKIRKLKITQQKKKKKSQILQVNATYPPINSLASTFNLSAHNPGLLFLTPVKKLFQEEHLARHGSTHPHLAPFCCKVEKTPARTACTWGTAGNTWCSRRTGTCVCRAAGPSSRGRSGKQHSLCCFLPAVLVHLQPARPFPAALCQCCSQQGRYRWRRVQDYLQTWRVAKIHIKHKYLGVNKVLPDLCTHTGAVVDPLGSFTVPDSVWVLASS